MECKVCGSDEPPIIEEEYCSLCFAAKHFTVQQFEEARARVSKYELGVMEGIIDED